jgi:toxin ParE1/3/4
MSFPLTVQYEAVFEIQEAFEWYESKRQGLGHELIEEIETGYEKICTYPEHYPPFSSYFRRYKLKRFPYLIVYEFLPSEVNVTSFVHTKRNKSFNP